jgi:hypothetical protein
VLVVTEQQQVLARRWYGHFHLSLKMQPTCRLELTREVDVTKLVDWTNPTPLDTRPTGLALMPIFPQG